MSRPKWKVFLVVGLAIIMFTSAATLRCLEEESLRGKIVNTGKMAGIERETMPTTVADL